MRNPVILNLHLLLWDSYISVWMSGRHRTDGRRTGAVTHLATLGVKITGTAFWVYEDKAVHGTAFFYG